MTVKDWFASRDTAYQQLLEVEESGTIEEIDAAKERWRETRKLLALWRRSETPEWRAEWREEQKDRIQEMLEEFPKD